MSKVTGICLFTWTGTGQDTRRVPEAVAALAPTPVRQDRCSVSLDPCLGRYLLYARCCAAESESCGDNRLFVVGEVFCSVRHPVVSPRACIIAVLPSPLFLGRCPAPEWNDAGALSRQRVAQRLPFSFDERRDQFFAVRVSIYMFCSIVASPRRSLLAIGYTV